jgi:hypothetical protein
VPTVVRYFIKTGLGFFLVSLLVGVLMLAEPFLDLPTVLTSNFATYLHLFMVGWITQLIFGVSIWMFPAPDRGGRYGHESVLWTIYWTLNLGLLLRMLGEPGKRVFQLSALFNWTLLTSALLQWTAGLLYAYHIWDRVRTR